MIDISTIVTSINKETTIETELLAYLAGFLLKVKNMVKCILDLIQKRKNSLGIW